MSDRWAEIIDKLTDPIETAFNKIFSARFLMAILTTYGAFKITLLVLQKYPDRADAVITFYMTTWVMIAKDYFQYKDRKPDENGKGQP